MKQRDPINRKAEKRAGEKSQGHSMGRHEQNFQLPKVNYSSNMTNQVLHLNSNIQRRSGKGQTSLMNQYISSSTSSKPMKEVENDDSPTMHQKRPTSCKGHNSHRGNENKAIIISNQFSGITLQQMKPSKLHPNRLIIDQSRQIIKGKKLTQYGKSPPIIPSISKSGIRGAEDQYNATSQVPLLQGFPRSHDMSRKSSQAFLKEEASNSLFTKDKREKYDRMMHPIGSHMPANMKSNIVHKALQNDPKSSVFGNTGNSILQKR